MADMDPGDGGRLACEAGGVRLIIDDGDGHSCSEFGGHLAHRLRSFPLINRTLVRALATSLVLATGVALAGCNSDEIRSPATPRPTKPVPAELVAEIAAKDMDLQSPMMVRLFKQETELEVWKRRAPASSRCSRPIRSAAGRATSAPRSRKATARRRRVSTASRPAR